jgi:two-component system cell cycle sensor histidine kinase/response regulator CckA
MMRALIVDDNEENLYYLTALLEGHGYEVQRAGDGAQALTRARLSPPDLVISDLLMPVMDGYTLVRHWKGDPRLRTIPFIVYTATYTELEDEQLALNLGADAFIVKPTEPEEFMTRIRGVTSTVMATAPASAPPLAAEEDVLLRQYNETLVRKLEHKTLQLEETNRSLKKDIAARELTEVALRESESSFRLLTEVLPQLVWISRADGWNTFFNQRWSEYTGLTFAESEGRGWMACFHPDDSASGEAAWNAALESGGVFSAEIRLRRSDGVYRWWLVRGLPLRDDAGSVLKWFGTCTDIDDMKQASAKLQRTEDQLRQAQKMEAIGQLAAGVAHDFNNLLSVILSYSCFIIDGLTPADPLRADVEEVRSAAQRAAELVRQLLMFSRQQVLKPRDIDLSKSVLSLDPMLRRLLRAQINLSVLAGESLGHVFVDPGQVDQILMNLVVNARDAMPDGGSITVDLANATLDAAYAAEHHGVTEGRYVMMTVSDTGHGMDAATAARIFEPFFTTKEKGQGTGLGLATVYGIVTQSGGHLSVDSAPASGATFKVYLPRHDGDVDLDLPEASQPMPRGTETILVVEDSEQVRTIERSILRRAGYNVLEAQNAGEALLICEQYSARIHLLLTDVVMPRMSGRDLALRVTARRPGIRVLYTSGYTEDAAVDGGVLDPGVDFLAKPITPSALLVKARQVLDRTSSLNPIKVPSARPPALNGEHILHVDDENSLVHLTARILKSLGYRVSGFTDPADALLAFQSNPDEYNAIVTDVTMPGMSGFDLIREVRRHRADIPVVVTAGYFGPEDVREAERLHLRALLMKPDTVDELGRVLHEEIREAAAKRFPKVSVAGR